MSGAARCLTAERISRLERISTLEVFFPSFFNILFPVPRRRSFCLSSKRFVGLRLRLDPSSDLGHGTKTHTLTSSKASRADTDLLVVPSGWVPDTEGGTKIL